MTRYHRIIGMFVADLAAIATIGSTVSIAGVSARVDAINNPAPAVAHASDDSRKGSVWVVNRDRGELAVFDAETGKVLTTLPVGAGAHDVCISERARKAYITAESINTVTTVDTRTLATEAIAVAPLPHHCETSHDGRTVYVSLASHTPGVGSPQYAAIDTDDNSVSYTTTSHDPAARSHAPHPSLDGDTVFVPHDLGDEVTGIDVESGDIGFTVEPILRAEEAIATRFGNLLWVSSRGDETVKRIDLDTRDITASVAVGVQPESVMLTPPSARWWLACAEVRRRSPSSIQSTSGSSGRLRSPELERSAIWR